MLMLLLLTPYF